MGVRHSPSTVYSPPSYRGRGGHRLVQEIGLKMTNLIDLIARANSVGAAAAADDADSSMNDTGHHIGDDTGRLISEAYRTAGATGAAAILDTYVDANNTWRAAHQLRELTAQNAVANLSLAISPDGITAAEQAEVRAAFLAE